MLKIRFGRFLVPLWLVAILTGLGVAAAYYIYTLTIPLEVKEPLELVSYPNKLSLYPGQTINFDVVIRNHASINYTVYLDFSLDNATYQNNYVEFSQEMYIVSPGENILKAWVRVEPFASPTNATLYVKILRGVISLTKIASGKIAYDSFGANKGTATEIPWSILRGNWTVENGMFKCIGTAAFAGAYACPTNIVFNGGCIEMKVKPASLIDEGPEIIIQSLSGEPLGENTPGIVFDYYNTGHLMRLIVSLALHVHSTYLTTGFTMETGKWYTMKIFVSQSLIKCYINEALVFSTTDPNILNFAPYRILVGGYNIGESGYIDYIKIYKSHVITIYGLKNGQRVELYRENGNLIVSDVVKAGEDKAILDVSTLTFPFKGYFKIYASDGVTTLCITSLYDDIWGGDEYTVNIGS
jgi:hypothetical protein